MCCDGTLFYSVVLQAEDSPRTLRSLGLSLKTKKGTTSLRQPCPAHQGGCCTIYDHRPARCRAFQCHQLTGVATGKISEEQARQTIQVTRLKIDRVLQKIEQITETNPSQGLAQRYAVALANSSASPQRTALATEMQELEEILNRDFRGPNQLGEQSPPETVLK